MADINRNGCIHATNITSLVFFNGHSHPSSFTEHASDDLQGGEAARAEPRAALPDAEGAPRARARPQGLHR